MQLIKGETVPIRAPNDIVIVRQKVRAWAIEIGFSIIEQTKIITAASELARNTLDYGGGGECELASVKNSLNKSGLQLSFVDQGPGIANLELALTDGYTSGGGLGMGLTGSRRLMNDFKIETEIGKGTRVTVIKWK
jgi:Anti-sigma regulatory factor (Ser/Thr protein kinase)